MRSMAFVATGYIEAYDGVSVYLENLLRALLVHPAVVSGAIGVDIFAAKGVAKLLRERAAVPQKSDTIRLFGVRETNNIIKMFDLQRSILQKGKYDVIFAPNPMPLFFGGKRRVKVIHDLTIKRTPELFSTLKHRYIDLLINYMKYFDDAIGYISGQTKADIARYYGIDEKKKRLLYVPNGIPFKVRDLPRPPMEEAFAKYDTEVLDFVVVGRINRSKGFDRILKFLRHFDRVLQKEGRYKSVTLHVAGKQTPETEALFHNAALQRIAIRFYGYVDDATLNKLYRDSHFCFFLSRNEGYGLPLVEAMWMGTIPVLSKIDVFGEIMGEAYPRFDDESGYEEAIETFMRSVLDDEAYRREIFRQIENAVSHEKEGYARAAENLVQYIQEAS